MPVDLADDDLDRLLRTIGHPVSDAEVDRQVVRIRSRMAFLTEASSSRQDCQAITRRRARASVGLAALAGAVILVVVIAATTLGRNTPANTEQTPLGQLAENIANEGVAVGSRRTVSDVTVTDVRPINAGSSTSIILHKTRTAILDSYGRGSVTEHLVGYEFASEADEAVYLAQGWSLPEVGQITTFQITDGPSTEELVAVANDEQQLEAWLTAGAESSEDASYLKFQRSIDALRETNLPAETRGALFEHLSQDSRVMQEQGVVDPRSRPSVAISLETDRHGLTMRYTAWLSPQTGDLLAEQIEILDDAPYTSAPAPTTDKLTIYVEAAPA